MRRVAIIATASGCGKTTFGRELATRLGVPFVELDAIHWQAGWTELDATELRRRVEPIVAGDAWVIDGSYRMKLGDLVLDAADTVVWLDLPRRVWLPRLVTRTLRRLISRQELWNGNRESLRSIVLGPDPLVGLRAPHRAPPTSALPERARPPPCRTPPHAERGGCVPALDVMSVRTTGVGHRSPAAGRGRSHKRSSVSGGASEAPPPTPQHGGRARSE